MNMVKQGIYKHFKGNQYRVHFVAEHSETLEEFVAYEALYENKDGKFWIRPVKSFEEQIERDGKKIRRFEFLENG